MAVKPGEAGTLVAVEEAQLQRIRLAAVGVKFTLSPPLAVVHRGLERLPRGPAHAPRGCVEYSHQQLQHPPAPQQLRIRGLREVRQGIESVLVQER